MKHTFLTGHTVVAVVAAGAALFLAGCGAELLVTTATRGELESQQAESAVRQLNQVSGQISTVQVEHAIRAYRAEHDANPPSLEALVPDYLPRVPRQQNGAPYHYDPQTGTVTARPGAATPMHPDEQMLYQIRQAINQYGTATGYYPPTLDDLYPHYLSEPPRTVSGNHFVYNNQNGYVARPEE